MKKLAIAVGILATMNAFALTSFEKDLSLNVQTFSGSKNYDAKFTNDDGTISIIGPKFSSPDGTGDLRLGDDSDLNGVCRLFGQKGYVANGVRTEYLQKRENTVVISSRGRFGSFDNAYDDYVIKSIICEPQARANKVSDNAQGILLNDDGTLTILKPQFMINGVNTRIGDDSVLNGICARFGLGALVENSVQSEYLQTRIDTTVLDGNGNFLVFDNAYDDYVIKSVMCEAGSGYSNDVQVERRTKCE